MDTNSMDYKTLATSEARKAHYEENGYVVYPSLIRRDLCDRALSVFRDEIKPFKGHIYRQASANPEKHVYDSAGHMINSLLNPIASDGGKFPSFRKISSEILTCRELYGAVEELLGSKAMMVQSMYFEGNPATWSHQDTYYLDGEKIGSMVAAWIALEDIDERAGRFYVGVKSHLIDMVKNGGDFDIAFNHQRYKKLVEEIIQKQGVRLLAPPLKKGDVLFWNSKTIHGSFKPIDCKFSRNSYTAHFIPAGMRFLQLQNIVKTLKTSEIGGHCVYLPKDQNKKLNRMIFKLECLFPKIFQTAKKIAVKIGTSKAKN